MTSDQITSIVENCRYPGQKLPVKWLETHISWVILSPEYVFKIKKPLQFPFLDFSSLEKRRFYCEEELRLNRRLAPEMYLGVLPVSENEAGAPEIGAARGRQIDTAVWMRRMDDSRQMDRLLPVNRVSTGNMRALAKILADFHQKVIIPTQEVAYRPEDNPSDFDDLFRLEKVYGQVLGAEAANRLADLQSRTAAFLTAHEPRLRERARGGFWVDGHGDLHGRNIFLLREGPVVFDCIEFNPHFRRLDVLSELAFLCMDLEAGGHVELADHFLAAYLSHWNAMPRPEDALLFAYFKAYRANVRLKVALLEYQQHSSDASRETALKYHALMERFLAGITTKNYGKLLS